MARVNYQLSHLIHVDAKAAKEKILEVLRAEKVHMGKTAAKIGCTHGTLLIWISKLDMADDVAKLKDKALKEGWHYERHHLGGGRPKMTKKEREEAKRARETAEVAALTRKERKEYDGLTSRTACRLFLAKKRSARRAGAKVKRAA